MLFKIKILIMLGVGLISLSAFSSDFPIPSIENEVAYYSNYYVVQTTAHRVIDGIHVYDWPDMDFFSDKELKKKVAEINEEGFFYKGDRIAEWYGGGKKVEIYAVLNDGTKLSLRNFSLTSYSQTNGGECKTIKDGGYFNLSRLTLKEFVPCHDTSYAQLYFLYRATSSYARGVVFHKRKMHSLFGLGNIFVNNIKNNVAEIDHPIWGKIYFDVSKVPGSKVVPSLNHYLNENKIGKELLSELRTLNNDPWKKVIGMQDYNGEEFKWIDINHSILKEEDESNLCFETYATPEHDQAFWCYNLELSKFFIGDNNWPRLKDVKNEVMIIKNKVKSKK